MRKQREKTVELFEDRVVSINRVTKVVKGGRRFRFAALVVIGDHNGTVGFGMGKAQEVPDAIKKAVEAAKKNTIKVAIVNNTIAHTVTGNFGAGKVFLRPASDGTGVIAGGAVRTICELAGINNILSKSLGSKSPINTVRATFEGLSSINTIEEIAALRGVSVESLV